MADFKDRKRMTDHPGSAWLGDSGAKGAKKPTVGEHHPELARAMAKRKKEADKKRAEKQKKLFEGKVKVG